MAERKSGPVKPPVIDLKAREPAAAKAAPERRADPAPAAPEKPAPAERPATAEPKPTAPEPPRPAPPRPMPALAMPWNAVALAAAIGAILGTVLTYVVVNWLPFPDGRPSIPDPTSRFEAQQQALNGLDSRLAAIEAQSRKTQVSLDATIAQFDTGLAQLRQSLAALPTPTAPVDIAPLQAQIDTLTDRLAALGAGASSADAEALASSLSTVETGLADLKKQLAAVDQRFGKTDGTVAALSSDLTAAKSAIAAQNQTLGGTEIGPAVRLPLLVSGLEFAFANGRPFTTELTSLTTLLPDLAVPASIKASAPTGLPRPDSVATRFEAIVPDILAVRTGAGSGDWGRDAVEWTKALLALRPTGEVEGDTPEAIVARLEAAVARRDFVAATDLLARLPAPMRTAAGEAGTEVETLAAAETFIAGLRAQALTPSLTPPEAAPAPAEAAQ